MNEGDTPNDALGKPCWLIWSIEHRAWWRPDCCGYTVCRTDAGRYTYLEAVGICEKANNWPGSQGNEAMCLDW